MWLAASRSAMVLWSLATPTATVTCAQEGTCITRSEPGWLSGACRVEGEEIHFELFAHAPTYPAQDASMLRWADWCARIIDQDGVTVAAVYGADTCLDLWEPGWRERMATGLPLSLSVSTRQADPVLLDCLGKWMDDASARQHQNEWILAHALAHGAVQGCLEAQSLH